MITIQGWPFSFFSFSGICFVETTVVQVPWFCHYLSVAARALASQCPCYSRAGLLFSFHLLFDVLLHPKLISYQSHLQPCRVNGSLEKECFVNADKLHDAAVRKWI